MNIFLIAIAAILNTTMDTLDHRLDRSIFRKWGRWFTGKNPGWQLYAKRTWWIPPITYDGWHCCKQLMILCFMLMPIKVYFYGVDYYFGVIEFVYYIPVWWVCFTLPYKYLFIRRRL